MLRKYFCQFLACVCFLGIMGCASKTESQTAAHSLTSSDKLLEAESLMYGRNYMKAIEILNGVIENDGPTAYALTLRGIAYSKSNKPNYAMMDLIEATHIDYSPMTLVNVGNAERMFGHCERAADAYNKALALAPNDVEIMTNLVSAYVCYGAFDLAEATFQKLNQFNLNSEILETNRAQYFSMKEDWQAARESAELAVKINPAYAPAYKVLMHVCGKMGDMACQNEAERQHKIATQPKSKVNYKR